MHKVNRSYFYSLYSSNLFALTCVVYFLNPPARFRWMYVLFFLVFVTSMIYHSKSYEKPKDPLVTMIDKCAVHLTIGMLGVCFYDRLEYWMCVSMIWFVWDSIHNTEHTFDQSVRHAGMHAVACVSSLYMLAL